jgi:hypothetical protein
MNTPSHWLMTVAAGRIGPWKNKVPKWSLGLGSLAPDIPLYVLSLGGIFYFSVWSQWPDSKTFPHMFNPDGLFFNDPIWITLHNLFHSPTSLLILFGLSRLVRSKKFLRWSAFFLAACGLHSVVDIATHNDDGPLLFFPFDWTTRFISPISYWDSDHFGFEFMRFEGSLDIFLVCFLLYSQFLRQKTPVEQA